MGRRGPAPKSAAELKIRGTFREDRHAEREAIPEAAGVPVKPASLKGEAGKHWDAVVPQLVANGTAKEIDTPALVALCKTWGRYVACDAKLDKKPEDKNLGVRAESYLRQWLALAAKLGLTPADRQRLRVDKPQTPEGVSAFARKRQA